MLRSKKQKSGMTHQFARNPAPKVQRSRFKRPARHKCTIDSGYLYPILVDEIVPGDTFNINLTAVCRLATPIVPIMDNMYLDFQFFFVPNRLVWDNWVKLQGERKNPSDHISYTVPQVPAPTTTGFSANSLYDVLGIRPGYDGFDINNLIPRGYNLIWNEWYRHPWIQTMAVVDTDDGPDDSTDYVLLRRGKRADYFTSCLPAAQRGTEIDLPLGTTCPVVGDGNTLGLTDGSTANGPYVDSNGFVRASSVLSGTAKGTAPGTLLQSNLSLGVSGAGVSSGLVADLSSATAATINSLREALALQAILEKDARGGTRYSEIVQNFFGVTTDDLRLQRPQYLGGGSRPITIEAIPQTSETNTTPQGTLTGIGYNQSHGIGMNQSFNEHGHIFCLCSVRADQTYQQGLRRMWSRQTRHDFYMPQLANLGEQAVLQKEIFMDGSAGDETVFGYIPRWDDMRYFPSMVTGTLRSDHAQSLDPWHLAPDFSVAPTLNSDFIEEDPPIDRIIATTNEPQFILDTYFDITCARPMPMFGIPGLVGRF